MHTIIIEYRQHGVHIDYRILFYSQSYSAHHVNTMDNTVDTRGGENFFFKWGNDGKFQPPTHQLLTHFFFFFL